VRWKADGTYAGGFPGAPAEAIGRPITFTGTDTLHVADGKLAEYWANADSLLFFQQLGVREIPASGGRRPPGRFTSTNCRASRVLIGSSRPVLLLSDSPWLMKAVCCGYSATLLTTWPFYSGNP